ncbi:putative F-box protein PP2-B12 [Sesamum indicum]|uniref:F-box protein PP2-B12 n=1 Tax=Sesamum indicum TaxID=4182 RepID=A0A6I9TXK0_SESIN|nr:putative F-box protein PP2-B12 [Sesamum indicum]
MAVQSCGDIHALPEDCIANALSLTSPKDACRMSVVASMFRAASQSDAVWSRFLPSDYREIISRAVDGSDSLLGGSRSKKDIYLHLCDHPILIDGGRKSFSLEKWSGKKCFMLAARELSIVWADTPQYWQWISFPQSRFPEVAELLDVCWFDIRAKIDINLLSPGTNYAAYLVFTCTSRFYGFDLEPAKSQVSIHGHEAQKRTVCLDPEREQTGRPFYHHTPYTDDDEDEEIQMFDEDGVGPYTGLPGDTEHPKQRDDGWMEVELGEYFVKSGYDGELEISLKEVKGGNWKSGLIIQGVEIRPKNCK